MGGIKIRKGRKEMITWIIIFLVLIALCALLWSIDSFDFLEVGLLGIITGVLWLIIVVLGCTVFIPQEINQFTQQQAYLETHIPDNSIEDAALTQKKIELNAWLYDTQFKKVRYGIFSWYPESVLELEPID